MTSQFYFIFSLPILVGVLILAVIDDSSADAPFLCRTLLIAALDFCSEPSCSCYNTQVDKKAEGDRHTKKSSLRESCVWINGFHDSNMSSSGLSSDQNQNTLPNENSCHLSREKAREETCDNDSKEVAKAEIQPSNIPIGDDDDDGDDDITTKRDTVHAQKSMIYNT